MQLGYGGNSGDVGGGGATGIRSKGATRTSGLRNKGTAISGEIDLERGRRGEYWPVAAAAAYTGLARGTSCEEVSPRPVRTDAALGLRAFWDQTVRTVVRIGLIRRRHSPERTQLHATMSGRARSSSS